MTMQENKDPRAHMATYADTSSKGARSAEKVKFYEQAPQESDELTDTWYCRGQNFVIALTVAKPGAVLSREGQIDEYVLILDDPEGSAEVSWEGQKESIPGFSVVMIPPGNSAISLPKGGRVTRLFTVKSEDLEAKCSNSASYATPNPNVPPFKYWPEPTAGWKIRSYPMRGKPPSGFAYIYRCTTFMVNYVPPALMAKPRPTTMMSPHHHDDFEQCSLCLEGSWAHHLRWPWTKDMADWRDDETHEMFTPHVLVIPPMVIHSSRGLSETGQQLCDVFCPPRADFSKQEGFVMNADEYPLPEGI